MQFKSKKSALGVAKSSILWIIWTSGEEQAHVSPRSQADVKEPWMCHIEKGNERTPKLTLQCYPRRAGSEILNWTLFLLRICVEQRSAVLWRHEPFLARNLNLRLNLMYCLQATPTRLRWRALRSLRSLHDIALLLPSEAKKRDSWQGMRQDLTRGFR
ncbi:unnamed protein product [Meganyctiphanes norvegica]|uniref:Uncharacterized protein n=1 Tax=Meganyctiphanes norvegica TaxID=48144 RepID=A0AAV2PJ35_MEGNR